MQTKTTINLLYIERISHRKLRLKSNYLNLCIRKINFFCTYKNNAKFENYENNNRAGTEQSDS